MTGPGERRQIDTRSVRDAVQLNVVQRPGNPRTLECRGGRYLSRDGKPVCWIGRFR